LATEANHIDGILETLAPDVELISPISGRMVFRGKDDIRVLTTAVYGSLSGLRWREEVGDGPVRVLIGDAELGPLFGGRCSALDGIARRRRNELASRWRAGRGRVP